MKRFTFNALVFFSLLGLSSLAPAALHEIAITNYAFVPASLTINAGDSVRWTNNDNAPHTVTATNGSFDSGYMGLNATYVRVFPAAGSVSYYCAYHPSMTGSLAVENSGGGHSDNYHEVSISGSQFQPASLTIAVGDTVVWTNNEATPHTVTASDNSFDSGYMGQGDTFAYVFYSAGSFPYVCLYHQGMTGSVTVQGGGGHSNNYHEVAITGFQFQPGDITIAVGDTVAWTNNDSAPHTVTASDNSFHSGNMVEGQTFTHVFTAAGDYPYVCIYHSGMSAVVRVAAAAVLHEVSISGFQFQPAQLHVNVGDTVRWTNNDSAPHTATATGGTFDSGNLNMGQSFAYVFDFEGTFPYVCLYHSNMTGSIIVGNAGGGESDWELLQSPTTLPLKDVRFWDENLGWAAGDAGILRTTNSGESWSVYATSDDVEAIYFVSAAEGWAAGNDGMLLHTTDGGVSWTPQNSGVAEKLRDIWFANAMTGWAVGRDGILIHTANGGTNWSPQTSPAVDDLRGIHMLNAQSGWIVGSDGLILYTSNGGANWVTQLSVPGGEEDEFEAVYALDANHAWAAGGQGRVYATTNGGQTWTQQATGTTVALQDIFFPTQNSGWVAGAGGFLSSWDTATQMWMTAPAPAVVTFNALHFVNENLGFMVGGDGSIYRFSLLPTSTPPHRHDAVPDAVELFANYPNPFNPGTTIEFRLHAASPVQLNVYDILGQHVATLADGPMDAGSHRLEFRATSLPSGLYFYQLRAGGQLLTRRMMLVK